VPQRRPAGEGRQGRGDVHDDPPDGARRCRLLGGGGRRRLRAENRRRCRGPAEGQRAAADGDARQGDREGAADRACGQGRGSRSGGDGVDSSRAADPQARRLLDRPVDGVWDRRPDRRPGGPPEGLGCQGHRRRRRGHRRSPRGGHRGCRPVGQSQPVALAVTVADCRHSGAHGVAQLLFQAKEQGVELVGPGGC
jgi:hypothetical protein